MGRKTHRVYARDQKAQLDGLETSRGKVNFGLQSAVYVDKETAEEVDARYGLKSDAESVIVAKDEQYDRALKGESWKIIHDEKRGDWVKTLHKYMFQGVDTSHFKVWVEKRGKIVRVTKAQAQAKGYKIISDQKRRPRADTNGGR